MAEKPSKQRIRGNNENKKRQPLPCSAPSKGAWREVLIPCESKYDSSEKEVAAISPYEAVITSRY